MIYMDYLTEDHVDRFTPAEPDRLSWTPENVMDLRTRWLGKAMAATDENDVLAIWGVTRDGDVGNVWIILSEAGRKYRKSLHKGAMDMVPRIMDAYGLKKLQAEVSRGFSLGHKWAERLGFHPIEDGPTVRYELCRL